MAIVTIQSPNGGTFEIDAPEGATDDQILRFAKSQGLFEQAPKQQPTQVNESSFTDEAIGAAENVASLVSGAVSEPLAGMAGIAQSINPFADEGAGAETVKATREALTYKPSTEAGIEQQQAVGEFIAPVAEKLSEAESYLGSGALDLTGSPFIASIAHSLPTAALEILGFKGSKGLRGGHKAPSPKDIKKAVVESAPEVEQIKKASRAIYKEIDKSGVTIKPKSVNSLVNKIASKTRKEGLDKRVSPKAAGAVDSIKEMTEIPQKLGELDIQRKIAQQVAKSPDPTEAMYGSIIIDEIDDFMDSLSAKDVTAGNVETAKKYSSARQLWGRAKRSELISEAIEKSADTASGSENGLRIELRKIVNNKKKSKFFTKEELNSMRGVIQGDKVTDTAKFIGTMGFGSGGGAHNLIPLIAASGAALANPLALAGPAIAGSIARKIAHSRSLTKTKLVDKVILAGKDGNEIAKAYLSSVPKSKRRASDLAELLSDPDVDLNSLKFIANETMIDAAAIAKGKRAIDLATGAALGAVSQQDTKTDESQ